MTEPFRVIQLSAATSNFNFMQLLLIAKCKELREKERSQDYATEGFLNDVSHRVCVRKSSTINRSAPNATITLYTTTILVCFIYTYRGSNGKA